MRVKNLKHLLQTGHMPDWFQHGEHRACVRCSTGSPTWNGFLLRRPLSIPL